MSADTTPIAQEQGQTADVFAADAREHERLERLSRVMEPFAREMCTRLGLALGARVIEFGCGPRGALPTFAAAVGPGGLVVGVDRDEGALDRARAILKAEDTANVRLVHADVNTLEPAEVCPPGPFDLAYSRVVLCYQTDAVAALRRMAATLRPGAYVVIQEIVLTAPIPIETSGRFTRAANLLVNEWFPALLGTLGTCWDVAERYSMLCKEAALVEVGQRVVAPSFLPADARSGITLYRDVLVGARPLLRRLEIASDDRIDHVLHELDRTIEEIHDATIFTHMQAELVARVP